MSSHPEENSPKVKIEEESHVGDSFPKMNKEEEPHPKYVSSQVNREGNFTLSGCTSPLGNILQEPAGALPFEEEEDDVEVIEVDDDDQSYENASNQLVVYNPGTNVPSGEIEPVPEPQVYQPPPYPTYAPHPHSRVLPSVGAFTVQCANCFKWRLIPSKEKYEEIRESILQQPFVCDSARAWRPEITCDDPADISQDGSRLWAIDKPNISQPPPGWQRLLRIRGEGSTKFADVYYATPSGKKLRSMVEVQKYLLEHPEYIRAGVTMAQFSFQIPKPLQDDYVRKRPARVTSSDGAGFSMSRPLEPAEVNPLSWASPIDSQQMQIASEPGQSTSYFEAPDFNPVRSPAKKQKTKSLAKKMYNNQPEFKVEEPQPSRNNPYDL